MGLVGQWNFDAETAAGEDTSANDNSAQFTDGTSGPTTMSSSFDGVNDYIEIADDAQYALDSGTIHGTYTVAEGSMDGTLPTGIGDASNQTLFSRDSSDYDGGGHVTVVVGSDGSIFVRHQSDTSNYKITTEPGVVTEGQEFDLVYSFSDTEGIKLYIDGEEVGSNTQMVERGDSISLSGNNEPWTVGASQHSSGDATADNLKGYFEGEIGSFEIFDEPLTPAEVHAIHDLSDGSDSGTVEGTEDDDLLYGGAGIGEADGGLQIDDTINGAGGDDTIHAGDGSDTIDGGTGNDTIYGGTGDDLITTGDGCDTIIIEQSGGNDTVTDFDLTPPWGEGKSIDQFDVSDLQNGDGAPVNVWDVKVTDDGSGNAVLTFPEGESVTLHGITPEQMTVDQMISAGIPCFAAGTHITTPSGARAVERLQAGDLVLTKNNGAQPIIWHASQHVTAERLRTAPQLAPIRINRSWIGSAQDLIVSPQHGIAFQNKDGENCFVRAIQLARLKGGQAHVARRMQGVSYFHIMLPRHEIIYSNGIATETFYPGPRSLAAISSSALLSLIAQFPKLSKERVSQSYGPTALPFAAHKTLPPRLEDIQLLKSALQDPAHLA